MRPLRQSLALLFLWIGFCNTGWSQALFTSPLGMVTDSTGTVIPGPTIAIVNKPTDLTSAQFSLRYGF